MIRTIISLEKQDKKWLDHVAKTQHLSMAKVMRLAIKEYQLKHREITPTPLEVLLNKTKGIWPTEDGLTYQAKIRGEWEK